MSSADRPRELRFEVSISDVRLHGLVTRSALPLQLQRESFPPPLWLPGPSLWRHQKERWLRPPPPNSPYRTAPRHRDPRRGPGKSATQTADTTKGNMLPRIRRLLGTPGSPTAGKPDSPIRLEAATSRVERPADSSIPAEAPELVRPPAPCFTASGL